MRDEECIEDFGCNSRTKGIIWESYRIMLEQSEDCVSDPNERHSEFLRFRRVFHDGFLLSLLFNSEDGGNVFSETSIDFGQLSQSRTSNINSSSSSSQIIGGIAQW